jgi:hypothetical protein
VGGRSARAAAKEHLGLLALRDALARGEARGRAIALDNRHAPEVLAQDSRGEQARHAGAEGDGVVPHGLG